MINRTKTRTLVAAVAASVAIAGCGSDDESAQAPNNVASSPAGTTAAGTTSAQAGIDPELAAWTTKFCAAVTAASQPLQPPSVASSTPEGTKASLVTFFGNVVSSQAGQIKALEEVGPPPGDADAKKEFDKAESDLRAVRKSVAKVVRKIKANKTDSASDVKSLVTDLGSQMKKLGAYQGPIADLGQTKSLGPAIVADSSCTAGNAAAAG